jgi:hypothetical protein
MIGFKLKNTLSPFGSVSRGECYVDETNTLKEVIERTQIERNGSNIEYYDTNGGATALNEDTLVSMNFWGFTPSVFEYGESMFKEFVRVNHNDPKSEFYVPLIVNTLIENKTVDVKVLSTDSKWHGITYKEDKQEVINSVKAMQSSRVYPKKLWQST